MTMKVAILAVASPQGQQGGAERFYQGLQSALQQAGAQADIVPVISNECDFEAIKQSYLRFYDLNLSAYDGVISTKAPGYLVRHPNHVCYLQHTMRVFYDMFEVEFPRPNQELLAQRELIHQLDTAALQPSRTRRIFTIGHEVKQRLKQFNGLDSEILYQASTLEGFHCGEYCYVFMPGRLHRWKRVDLVIKAMQYVRAPVELLISGIGEDEQALRALAAGDQRIRFLGRVTDSELLDLYADALVVPFVPLHEDFGLVTLEAFHSQKPVITCHDSGEPARLIQHQYTGFVCAPDPEEIAQRIEQLISKPDLAVQMGRQGAKSIQPISWDNVAATLLSALESGCPRPTVVASQGIVQSKNSNKLKVAVLDMQPIAPPVGGGRLRLLGLYHNLGDNFETTYIGTFDWPGPQYREHWLSETLQERDVPLSEAHFKAADALKRRANGKTVIDAAFHQQAHLSPEFGEVVRQTAQGADVVIFSHPWLWLIVKDVLVRQQQLIVYDSQNVEGFLKLSLLDDGAVGTEIAREVIRIEYELCHAADLVLACSNEDKNLFNQLYYVSHRKIRVVPNGVFANRIKPATLSQKSKVRQELALGAEKVALFIGSSYPPNIKAAQFIIKKLAPSMPEFTFVILGGAGSSIIIPNHLKNVRNIGMVSEETKAAYLQAADMALNPVDSGSGTNIKMFDFMAAGLPVITSNIGARGIPNHADQLAFIQSSLDSFSQNLQKLVTDDLLTTQISSNARNLVEKEFAWESISPNLGKLLSNSISIKDSTVIKKARHLVIMSSLGVKCGIAEYTKYFIDGLSRSDIPLNLSLITTENYVHSVDSFTTDRVDHVLNVWNFDNKNWTDSSIDFIKIKDFINRVVPDHFNLQYHPGFFDVATLKKLFDVINRAGLSYSITLHNSRDLQEHHLRLFRTIDATLMVHTIEEAENLRSFGLEAVEVIPHGVIEFPDESVAEARLGQNIHGNPILATFGFLRPYKGIKQFIEALKFLKPDFPNIQLIALTALYPSLDSQEYFRICKARVHELDLHEHITLVTDFLAPEEILQRLHIADIVVLPYEDISEGASGAAAFAIACRRPLMITASRAFFSLKDIAYQLSSNAPEDIAAAIRTFFFTPSLAISLKQRISHYADQHAWHRVAQIFIEKIFCLPVDSHKQTGLPT